MDEGKILVRRSPIFLGQRTTSLFNRFAAKAIDLVIGIAIYFLGFSLWPWLGVALSCFYVSFHDAMGGGQSLGKRIMGLRVIEEPTGLPCPYLTSVVRNLPFVVGILCLSQAFLLIPLILFVLPVIGLEVYLIFSIETGVRLGDIVANTLVYEYSDLVMEEPTLR